MNLRGSLIQLVSVALVGTVVGRGLNYAVNVVLAREFGPEIVGIFALGTVILNIGSIMSRIGLDGAVKRRVPIHRNRSQLDQLAGTTVASLLIPAVIGSAIGLTAYLTLQSRPNLFNTSTESILPFLIAIPVASCMRVGISLSQGFKETRYMVYVRDIVQPGFALIGVSLGAYIFVDEGFAFFSYATSFVAGTIVIVIALIHLGAFRRIDRPSVDLRSLLRLAAPLFFSSTVRYFVFWADIIMLGIFVTSIETGKYQVAYQTSILLTFILTALNSLFPSVAADLYEESSLDRLAILYTVSTKWVVYLTSFGYAVIVIFAKEFLSIFGPEFISATTLLIIVSTGQLIAVATGPAGFMLTMTKGEYIELMNTTVVAMLNVVLNYILIQRYGVLGAAVATGFSIALLNLLRLVEVRLLFGILPYSRNYLRGAASLILAISSMLLVEYGLQGLPGVLILLISASIGGLILIVSLRTFAITERDYILFDNF